MMARGGWRDTFYARADWRRKSKRQILNFPLCAICLEQGKTVKAEVADHITPHHGDLTAFLRGELQSLCRSCNSKKQADDRRGYSTAVGPDGQPLDKRHPYWARDRAAPDTKPDVAPAPPKRKNWTYC
jgi:5-methylcytosine-specific restriction endonuclease McrA